MSTYATIIWILLIFRFFRAPHLRIIRPSYLENLCCNLKRHYVDFLHWYLCSALVFPIFHLIMHINFEMHCPHPHVPSNRPDFPVIKYHTYLTAKNFCRCQNTQLWTKFEMHLPLLIKKGNILAHVFWQPAFY